MDFGKAFTFVFEDAAWLRKLGLASLVFLVSFILIIPGILFALGYPIAVGRNVLKGVKHPLPEVENLGEIFKDGFFAFLISLFYALPLFVVIFPFALIFGIFTDQGGDAASAVAGVAIILFSCLVFIASLALAFFLPGVLARYIQTGDFSSCFQIREIWRTIVQPNLAQILLIFLATIAAQLVAQLLVGFSVITFCGPFILLWPATVWTTAVQGHLYGQLALAGGGLKEDLVSYA